MLPTPSTIAIEHSERLTYTIRQALQAAGGVLSFADYMNLALYAPKLGYYVAGAHKFGAAGDFITAPEISPVYAHCLATQCAQVLTELGRGDILELGAGSGKMAGDLLAALAQRQCLPDHYYILEVSPDLTQRQRDYLTTHCAEWIDRIHWLTHWPTTPFRGVILANEVLDAMPVHQFVWRNQRIFEWCVGWEDGQFITRPMPPLTTDLTAAAEVIVNRYLSQTDDYYSEINLNLAGWFASIDAILEQGLCLLIDYGFPQAEYYHPSRHQGTLMCHYRHHAHPDPFLWPGLQDITAHVDFTDVLHKAVATGLTPSGYTSQAYFLLSCGLDEWLANQPADPRSRLQQHQAIQRLTLPSEMGELFKVIGFTKHFNKPLLGFQFDNRLGRL